MKALFTVLDGSVVEVAWNGHRTTVRTLEDVRRVLDAYREFDAESLAHLGIIACLFAAREQWRSGGDLSWSGLQKALDPHFFVLQESRANTALQRGIEEAIDRIRELRSAKQEGEFERELIRMLTQTR